MNCKVRDLYRGKSKILCNCPWKTSLQVACHNIYGQVDLWAEVESVLPVFTKNTIKMHFSWGSINEQSNFAWIYGSLNIDFFFYKRLWRGFFCHCNFELMVEHCNLTCCSKAQQQFRPNQPSGPLNCDNSSVLFNNDTYGPTNTFIHLPG